MRSTRGRNLFLRWREKDISERHVSVLAALKINWARLFFMTIQCAAGDSGNFLIIDYGLPILYNLDHASNQGDIKALPLARFARQLRRWRQKTVDSTGVMTWRLLG